MFNIFKKKPSTVPQTPFFVQPLSCPSINFDQFIRGIDNLHIDVYLSPHFTELCTQLSYELLDERSSTKKRATDKVSEQLRVKLNKFNSAYNSLLKAAIHHAHETKQTYSVQLFQIAAIKWLLSTVRTQLLQLLYDLRTENLKGRDLSLSERLRWLNRQTDHLLYRVTNELFDEIHWVEESVNIRSLRESLLGMTWTLAKSLLFNPLLQSPDIHYHEVLMKYYVLLSKEPESRFGFNHLKEVIDQILEEVARTCQVKIDPSLENNQAENIFINDGRVIELHFSWKDVPENMEFLFNIPPKSEQSQLSATKLKIQRQANKILEQGLRQAQAILPLLAAYETPRLYEHYTKLLKPYLLYQALCDEIKIAEVKQTLENKLKLRHLRRKNDKPLNIKELKQTKTRLARLASHPNHQMLSRFLIDFIRYQRDLKYLRLIQEAMESINLLSNKAEIQLSQSNQLLYEFLEQGENNLHSTTQSIRSHVILKADLRGFTVIMAKMEERELNPSSHFTQHLFKPLNQLLKTFGAEKVFIEGDALIFSLFEYNDSSEDFLIIARACGLAQGILTLVHQQNDFNRIHNLQPFELGLGICYSAKAPKFLYDGEQRIMISSAIGKADRLSSCSSKLRQKYLKPTKLLTQVIVFKKDDKEKGISTFRYNINGIELDPKAFEKLESELTLHQAKIRLPNDEENTNFYIGNYLDLMGEKHELVIREGQVQLWQENMEYYPPTDEFYYEIVTNPIILNALKTDLLI
jgi:hypothetical protein